MASTILKLSGNPCCYLSFRTSNELAYGYLNVRGIGNQFLIETLTPQLAENLIPDDSSAILTTGGAIASFLESSINSEIF